jgi:hypothetical protein
MKRLNPKMSLKQANFGRYVIIFIQENNSFKTSLGSVNTNIDRQKNVYQISDTTSVH